MGGGMKDATERRLHPRDSDAAGAPAPAARLRTGSPLRVLNTSPDGMLVESPARLLPGRQVDLVLETGTTREQAPWIVVHSRVGCIRGSSDLRYRAGLRRAMGSRYPLSGERRRTGHELPAVASPLEPQRRENAVNAGVPRVGTQFGNRNQT